MNDPRLETARRQRFRRVAGPTVAVRGRVFPLSLGVSLVTHVAILTWLADSEPPSSSRSRSDAVEVEVLQVEQVESTPMDVVLVTDPEPLATHGERLAHRVGRVVEHRVPGLAIAPVLGLRGD